LYDRVRRVDAPAVEVDEHGPVPGADPVESGEEVGLARAGRAAVRTTDTEAWLPSSDDARTAEYVLHALD